MRLGIDFLAHRLGSGRQCFMMALPVLPVMRRTTAGPLASGAAGARPGEFLERMRLVLLLVETDALLGQVIACVHATSRDGFTTADSL